MSSSEQRKISVIQMCLVKRYNGSAAHLKTEDYAFL